MVHVQAIVASGGSNSEYVLFWVVAEADTELGLILS
jgi:hypothetical protein